jgi:hypothetical protein
MGNLQSLCVAYFPASNKQIKRQIVYPTCKKQIWILKQQPYLFQTIEAALRTPEMKDNQPDVQERKKRGNDDGID